MEEAHWTAAAGQTHMSATQILCQRMEKGVELQATQQLHPGEVIHFFLTSSVSADFSNQAIHPVLRGRGMKGWVTAVAPLGQHAEGAGKHEPCLPDPAGQDSDAPALSGLHVGPALCQSPQAPTGSFSPDPPAVLDAGSSSICCCCFSEQKMDRESAVP